MKRVIITGASDGLGLELSKFFIKKKYEVIAISRRKPDLAGILHLKTDLTKESDINHTTNIIKKHYSLFDCVINCAGVMNVKPIDSLDYNETVRLFKINVIAPMILNSRLIDLIKKNNADIVNVGSTIGFTAFRNRCAYGSSKWALRGLNENLRLELRNSMVRVISFIPSGIKTKFVEKHTGAKSKDFDSYIETKNLAKFMIQILELPKKIEISEVVINRKFVCEQF